MYLLWFTLITVTSFHLPPRLPIRTKLHNDKLRQIDDKLNAEKQKIKQLLNEKNNILKNMTGLTLHNESYISKYLDYINHEHEYEEDDQYDNEYDYEFKPRPNKINIIINTNQNQKTKQTTKS